MEIVEKKISNTLNKNLMDEARESLRNKWDLAIRHISGFVKFVSYSLHQPPILLLSLTPNNI